MMLAETIVSEILDGKNKTALMRINDILEKETKTEKEGA